MQWEKTRYFCRMRALRFVEIIWFVAVAVTMWEVIIFQFKWHFVLNETFIHGIWWILRAAFFRTSLYLTNINLNKLFIFKYWCCHYYHKTLSKNSHIESDIWMCQFNIKTTTMRSISVWQVKEKDVKEMVSWSGYRLWSKELHLSSNHRLLQLS